MGKVVVLEELEYSQHQFNTVVELLLVRWRPKARKRSSATLVVVVGLEPARNAQAKNATIPAIPFCSPWATIAGRRLLRQ
jgi:hypothetical protein